MEPEKIILPDFVLADLFRNHLVLPESEALEMATPELATVPEPRIKTAPQPVAVPQPAASPAPAPTTSKPKQWYLGNNLRHISLVVTDDQAVYLQDESLQFISSILGACKLNLGDVAIINHHNEPADYPSLKKQLSPRYLILFGVTAQQLKLPFTVPYYQVQSYDQCQFLLAPALTAMLGTGQEAKLEKSKLWLCLKKMFNL